MSLRDQIGVAHKRLATDTSGLAVSVTYTPVGGSETTVTGIFTEHPSEIRDAGNGAWEARTGELFLSRDATVGIASPADGDKAVINGETWYVKTVERVEGEAANLDLVRYERKYVAAEGHVNTHGG